MISHKYKCIFIHIAKCAGTTVEYYFGVNLDKKISEHDNMLYGWDNKNKLWLQHSTPQQLIDLNLISIDEWNSYYKFIIYRNSWDKCFSDFNWMKKTHRIDDTFENYIKRRGKFSKTLNDSTEAYYSGDHLTKQKEYFYLNGERIDYDLEIKFSQLKKGFEKLKKDLSLPRHFFSEKKNESSNKRSRHYSRFYDDNKKRLVEEHYKDDIEFFDFKFNRPLFGYNFLK